MNNSLSVTLERFYTETRVTFDASLTEDQLILNKEAVNAKESAKIQRYMDMIRKEAGISTYALIESDNFVPTAAGLASSASAYAALAGACNEALDLNLSDKDLSRLARRGSGSASKVFMVVLLNGKKVMMIKRLTPIKLSQMVSRMT